MKTIHYLCTRSPTEFYTASAPEIIVASRASYLQRSCTEVAGYAPGATALASGYNFSSANKNFSVGVNGKTPTTILRRNNKTLYQSACGGIKVGNAQVDAGDQSKCLALHSLRRNFDRGSS